MDSSGSGHVEKVKGRGERGDGGSGALDEGVGMLAGARTPDELMRALAMRRAT